MLITALGYVDQETALVTIDIEGSFFLLVMIVKWSSLPRLAKEVENGTFKPQSWQA